MSSAERVSSTISPPLKNRQSQLLSGKAAEGKDQKGETIKISILSKANVQSVHTVRDAPTKISSLPKNQPCGTLLSPGGNFLRRRGISIEAMRKTSPTKHTSPAKEVVERDQDSAELFVNIPSAYA